jgi:hypothetical protein
VRSTEIAAAVEEEIVIEIETATETEIEIVVETAAEAEVGAGTETDTAEGTEIDKETAETMTAMPVMPLLPSLYLMIFLPAFEMILAISRILDMIIDLDMTCMAEVPCLPSLALPSFLPDALRLATEIVLHPPCWIVDMLLLLEFLVPPVQASTEALLLDTDPSIAQRPGVCS